LKSQLKRADKSGASHGVLIEAEDRMTVKDLRGNDGQRTIAAPEIAEYLAARLSPRIEA
jgi:hypothetical protein